MALADRDYYWERHSSSQAWRSSSYSSPSSRSRQSFLRVPRHRRVSRWLLVPAFLALFLLTPGGFRETQKAPEIHPPLNTARHQPQAQPALLNANVFWHPGIVNTGSGTVRLHFDPKKQP